MLRLIGFICGISLILFVVQPWMAVNYPGWYQKGKEAADEIIDSQQLIEVSQKVDLPPIKDLVLDDKQIETSQLETQVNQSAELVIEQPKTMIRQLIWSPFKYETSANAFARQINEMTQINVIIERNSRNDYQLILEAYDEQKIQQEITQIEQALGLKLSKSVAGH